MGLGALFLFLVFEDWLDGKEMANWGRQKLISWLEPEIEALGYELLDLQIIGGRDRILRFYIDGPEGIGLDDCARVSEAVGALLDVEDCISTTYQLEISSPGPERPLRTARHFSSFLGSEVRIVCKPGLSERRYLGRIQEVNPDTVYVSMGETLKPVNIEDIESARLVGSKSEYSAKTQRL